MDAVDSKGGQKMDPKNACPTLAHILPRAAWSLYRGLYFINTRNYPFYKKSAVRRDVYSDFKRKPRGAALEWDKIHLK